MTEPAEPGPSGAGPSRAGPLGAGSAGAGSAGAGPLGAGSPGAKRARPALAWPGVVAIDARAAVRPELGGVERWARELAARLPALRSGGYAVVAPRPAFVHRAGHAWEQLVLPARAARMRAAAVLCPANLAPLALRRTIVIVHDAAALRHPGWYSRAYVRWQRTVLPPLARRALHVLTVSEFSRGELRDLLGLAPERVSVVPGGIDPRFAADADPAPARRALGLNRPYVLCVASLTARKNLRALVPAAQALRDDGIELVVAGGHRPQFAAEAGLDPVRLIGAVSDDVLPGLYAGAEAFVLPSHYEGFGLPVLEAMACGTPVVASNTTALPEAAGDAARLVEPDPEVIREAVKALLADDEERARRRAAGLERATHFTWDRTARRVDAVIAAVLAG